ncbi:hypothetical protein [Methanolobus sp. ZRKC5]|uniref:hypothetical protein n=1 Tax=unclassified Methanolobus TaxID=2629569 RepID=UPI00313B9BCF
MFIAEEKECVMSPPFNEAISMGGSEFGSSFLIRNQICEKEKKNGKCHFQVEQHNVNWEPITITTRLILLSHSIKNILSYLKIENGVKQETVTFSLPSDLSVFNKACKPLDGVLSMNSDSIINQEDIEIFTKEEILAVYNQTEENEVHEG